MLKSSGYPMSDILVGTSAGCAESSRRQRRWLKPRAALYQAQAVTTACVCPRNGCSRVSIMTTWYLETADTKTHSKLWAKQADIVRC